MSKRDLPCLTFGARPRGLNAEMPSPSALERWNPGLQARAPAAGGDGPLQLDVLEVIGEDPWTGEGVTARKVSALLRAAGPRDVVVNVNSPGGNVFEGLAIYNMLREHPGAVTVRILGIAASAASVVAMAGDRVEIARSGFFMIHNVWGGAVGDKHVFAEVIEYMAMVDEALADLYAQRATADAAAIAEMMKKDTYLSGKAAIAAGFADGYLPSDAVSADMSASAEGEASGLQLRRTLEAGLAALGKSRGEARAMLKPLFSGTPSAAGDEGKPSAAVLSAFAGLLAEVKATSIRP